MTASPTAAPTSRDEFRTVAVLAHEAPARPVFVDETGRRVAGVRVATTLVLLAGIATLLSLLSQVLTAGEPKPPADAQLVRGAIFHTCGWGAPVSRVELLHEGTVIATAALDASGEFSFLLPRGSSGYTLKLRPPVPVEVRLDDSSMAFGSAIAPPPRCSGG